MKDARALTDALGLDPADGIEIAVRSELNTKIIEVVSERGLTDAAVAKVARTSRARVAAIMSRNTEGISTDLMLRVLNALAEAAADEELLESMRELVVRLGGSCLTPREVEKAWVAEVDKRVRDVKVGRVKLVAVEEALRDVRAGLKRARAQRAR